MGERAGLIAKAPEVKQSNSNSRVRRTERLQSMDTPVDRILFLQRTAGNRAVSRLIRSGGLQAKLRIGQPGDVYEQEADRVADEVMRMPEQGVQRQVEPEEEEETLQPKPLTNQITPLVQVQRQEELEEEKETLQAKPLAKEITSLVHVHRQEEPEEEEETLQAKPLAEEITPLVQRQVEPEEEEEELQAKATSGRISEANPNLESDIQSLKGGGQPLSENDRAFFEPRFGRDFSQVRVHTDTKAAESARAMNARAFTVGRDVVFGGEGYAPGTTAGGKLLAHELTHVVQQDSSSKILLQRRRRKPKSPMKRLYERREKTLNEKLDKLLSETAKKSSRYAKKKAKKEIEKLLNNAPKDLENKYAIYKRCFLSKPQVLQEEIKAAFPIDADNIIKLLPKKMTVKEYMEIQKKKRIKEAEKEFPKEEREHWQKKIKTEYTKDSKLQLCGLWLLENWVTLMTDAHVKKVMRIFIDSPKDKGVNSIIITLMSDIDKKWVVLINVICVKDTWGKTNQTCCQEIRNWMMLFKKVAPNGRFAKLMRSKVKWLMKQRKYQSCKFTSADMDS